MIQLLQMPNKKFATIVLIALIFLVLVWGTLGVLALLDLPEAGSQLSGLEADTMRRLAEDAWLGRNCDLNPCLSPSP